MQQGNRGHQEEREMLDRYTSKSEECEEIQRIRDTIFIIHQITQNSIDPSLVFSHVPLTIIHVLLDKKGRNNYATQKCTNGETHTTDTVILLQCNEVNIFGIRKSSSQY
jgi:hypothetical protein